MSLANRWCASSLASVRRQFKIFSVIDFSVENVLFYERMRRLRAKHGASQPATPTAPLQIGLQHEVARDHGAPGDAMHSWDAKKSDLHGAELSPATPLTSGWRRHQEATTHSDSDSSKGNHDEHSALQHELRLIYRLFFRPHADYELNVEDHTRRQIMHQATQGQLTFDMYDAATVEVARLMREDSWPRFLRWLSGHKDDAISASRTDNV
ncbi:hypothetical protein THASP1DRAFT_27799 [Thamnocephalis sphaerospora]|uniref:RGS domain-containing protein n=1 Tax=Thamnocephalis sphaerospora TaxID=78915 RepID=A0A4P9XVV9_9FUNG|nr:hypothetical protein THASP1DRAFT_27799 [Thamnocephalis sphaerospora]|eukprot:RKP10427.1 hypothetical protein THASP1DRAFT_27799 [Thamnocephalis sphaerospora]